jgi:hypothetical protein
MSVDQNIDPVSQDFRKFVYLTWKTLNLPDPTPVQYDIAKYLQNGPKRSIIEAFRGVGKSWLTSAFVCWVLYNNPQLKILVVSASKERADAFASFVKRLIQEMPILQHLQANEGQRDSMLSFDVGPALPDHSPSVKSVGITGQLTGSRADLIIADDIEVINNSATQIGRDKLSELVKEFDAILKPLDHARIIYLGTPQTEMSLYNKLPERGYELRVWTAEYPLIHKVEAYKGALAPFLVKKLSEDSTLVGQPTDPKRFGIEDLEERKASYGKAGYAMQFMLDTTLSDGDRYPLKIADLIIQNLNPVMAHMKVAWATSPELCISDLPNLALTGDRFYRPMWHSEEMHDYTGAVMSIDPSGRGKDETGYAVVKMLTGNLFLTDQGGYSGGYSEETLIKLAETAKRNNVKQIIVESNFGDGMFSQLLKPVLGRIYPCSVEEVRHSQQKELRIIDTLEPVMGQHRLIVDQKLIQKDYDTSPDPKYSLFYQMTRLTRDRGALVHDDRLDALAIAVAFWTEAMARDNNKAVDKIKTDLLDKELKNFIGGVLGKPKREPRWHGYNSAMK